MLLSGALGSACAGKFNVFSRQSLSIVSAYGLCRGGRVVVTLGRIVVAVTVCGLFSVTVWLLTRSVHPSRGRSVIGWGAEFSVCSSHSESRNSAASQSRSRFDCSASCSSLDSLLLGYLYGDRPSPSDVIGLKGGESCTPSCDEITTLT